MKAQFAVLFAFVFFTGTTHAAKLLKATTSALLLSTESGEAFHEGDQVCAESEGKTLACGPVVKRVGSKIAMKITKLARGAALSSGQTVGIRKMQRTPASQTAASAMLSMHQQHTASERNWALTLGGNAGLNYFYPMAHAEVDVGSQVTLGVMPLFFYQAGTSSQAVGFGGFLTAGYYFGRSTFEGLGVLGGAGAYSLGLTFEDTEETALALAGIALLQYRHQFGKSAWNVGLGAGIQYVLVSTDRIALNFSGLLPYFTAYIGWVL